MILIPLAFALTVALSADPKLPAPNLLTDPRFQFNNGLEGWVNGHSNEVCCVETEGRGLSFFAKNKKSVWTEFPKDLVKPGQSYILSCDIKPSPKVNTRTFSNGGSGLGCELSFWSGDWKRVVSLGARTEGPNKWFRTSSRPVTIPDWIAHGQLSVGLAYSDGEGCVDNIELVEAYSKLTVRVESSVAIRQVKIVDNDFRTVYDSGVLTGESKTWTRALQIEAAHKYAVFAVDSMGDVKVARYPASSSSCVSCGAWLHDMSDTRGQTFAAVGWRDGKGGDGFDVAAAWR